MALVFDSTSSKEGQAQLNSYLSFNTYVFGYALSAADASLFTAVGAAPDASKFPHFARWYNHVASFSADERAAAAAISGLSVTIGAVATTGGGKKEKKDEEMDIDNLFGSDDDSDDSSDDDDLVAKAKAEAAKKKFAAGLHKRQPVGRSRIVFEIKPYDIETDLLALAKKVKAQKLEGEFWEDKMENCLDVRCSLKDGCKWGEGHNLEPVAFGINKLVVQCTVQDELVGSDDLIEIMMTNYEDEIQSIDVAAFDKAS